MRLAEVAPRLAEVRRRWYTRLGAPEATVALPPLSFIRGVWEPFPEEPTERRRRIRLLDVPPLGFGSFGVVLAAAIEVPGTGEENPLVTLAAMKMSALTSDHLRETINGMAVNMLSESGASPGFVRMIDSFAITTTATATRCQMPPNDSEWARVLWTPFDRFVYKKRDLIAKKLGPNALRADRTNDQAGMARLDRGSTVAFFFSELSLHFLVNLRELRRRPNDVIADLHDDRLQELMLGLDNGRALVAHLYQLSQSFAALHAVHLTHGDFHSGNVVQTLDPSFRSERCLLQTDEGRALREKYFDAQGDRARPPLHPANDCVEFRAFDEEFQSTVISAPTHGGQPLIIDFGALQSPAVPEGSLKTRADFETLLFGPNAPEEIRAQAPSPFTLSHTQQTRYARRTAGSVGFSVLTGPLTNIYTRPFEQLNPFVAKDIRASSLLHEHAGYYSLHSEYSDVYSLAAVLAERILGFNIFGNVIRGSLVRHAKESDVMMRSRGPRMTLIEEKKAQRSESDPSRRRLTYTYQDGAKIRLGLRNAFFVYGALEPTLREIQVHEHGSALSDSFSSGSGGGSSSSPHSPTPLNKLQPLPRSTDFDPERDVLHLQMLHDRQRIVGHIKQRVARQGFASRACNFYGYKPGLQSEASWDESALNEAADGILSRINAVGLPDDIEGLRYTFLYDFLVECKRLAALRTSEDARERNNGWLYLALCETLTRKWAIEQPLAVEFARKLCEALSLDPAMRPTAARLLQLPLFTELLQRDGSQCTWSALWSASRLTERRFPRDFVEKPTLDFLRRHLTKVQPSLFAMSQSEQREFYNEMDWALTAAAPIAQILALNNEALYEPCVMTRCSQYYPRLVASESAQIAFYNCHTGLLDFHTGRPVARSGFSSEPYRDEHFCNVFWATAVNREVYWRVVHDMMLAQKPIPSWPLVQYDDASTEEDADESAHHAKRQRTLL